MTTATKQYMKDQTIDNATELTNLTDLAAVIKPGDFLSAPLVTDTVVYEVIKVTPKTVTMRETTSVPGAYTDESCDIGGYGTAVMWHPVAPNEKGRTMTRRISKDGILKIGSYARAGKFSKCMLVNGQPVKRIDHRY